MIARMATPEPNRLLLSDLLSIATIELQLKSNQRDAVLMELVNKIPELADRPDARQTLMKALVDREGLHSTGIGDGIALPHARNALVGLVEKPVIVFGRHINGVPYGSIDGVPAKLFFLLVAPNVSQHLQILARISRLLRMPKLREQLLAVERAEKALGLFRETESKL